MVHRTRRRTELLKERIAAPYKSTDNPAALLTDVWANVFSNLDYFELKESCSVNKFFNHVITRAPETRSILFKKPPSDIPLEQYESDTTLATWERKLRRQEILPMEDVHPFLEVVTDNCRYRRSSGLSLKHTFEIFFATDDDYVQVFEVIILRSFDGRAEIRKGKIQGDLLCLPPRRVVGVRIMDTFPQKLPEYLRNATAVTLLDFFSFVAEF